MLWRIRWLCLGPVCWLQVLLVGVVACSPPPAPRDTAEDASPEHFPDRQVGVAEGEIELASGSVWFREAGHGPLVLLLHGWRGNADQWRHQIQPLANAGWRVVAPDLLGTRNSPLKDEGIERRKPELHVSSMVELLDRLEVNSAHVVGHSWGGLTARRLALEHPRRISSLVLVDSAVHPEEIDALETIECPTLIVWAENDTVAPVGVGRLLSELIPGAQLVVIRDVGIDVDPAQDPVASHVPPLYKPEEFNRHLLDFLASQR